jgi:hypothetical protein
MKRTLKRIAPVKFGIVAGIIYGLIALVFVPFFLLSVGISALATVFGSHSDNGASAAGGIVGVVVGLLFCILLPVLYAVIGGLFGMLAAWLYNVVAGWVGGIEFEVE